MSKQVIKTYSFNTSAKTVTLTDFSAGQPVRLDRLALITDTTTNQILYNFADTSVATAAVSSNNVITLSALPSGVANSDSLRIDYDVVSGDPTYDTPNLASGAATSANQTNGNQQTKITNGTNIADVVANDSGLNGLIANHSMKLLGTFSTSGTGAQTLAANTDVRAYASLIIVWTSVGSGLAVSGQFAPTSGGTYINGLQFLNVSSATTLPTSLGVTNNNRFITPRLDAYFQIAVTALTSGTATAIIYGSTTPVAWGNSNVQGTKTNNNAAPGATNTGALTAIANAAAQTWAEGNQVLLSTDLSGNTRVKGTSEGATGSAVPANALYQGVNPQTALPTAATAGNLTGATADKFGRQVVLPNAMRDIMGSQTTTISASTSETTIITAAASIFNDLVSVFISNTSATAARVDIRDTTAGTIIFQLYVPPGDMRGLSLTTPWPQTSVNTNWTAQSSASVTDLRVSCLFIKNK